MAETLDGKQWMLFDPDPRYGPKPPTFQNLLDKLKEIHEKKSNDYGTSVDLLANLRGSEGIGIPAWVGALIRVKDKLFRLESEAARVVERTAFNDLVGLGNADKMFAAIGADTPRHLAMFYTSGMANESIEDTCLDAAAYFLLIYILHQEEIHGKS